jgi:hypothetical protein
MSDGQRAAMELTEAARDESRRSFLGELFMGRVEWPRLHPYPDQSAADRDAGRPFLEKLERLLRERVDADEIDRTGEIPDTVVSELASIGAFGIKIPKEYGGLGLSQTNYCRAAALLGSWCGNTTALISAHQSIGVPQPLLLFGTDEQKKKYLPRVARGEISAFALTEKNVGSDPARMETRAEPTPDGKGFIVNGEKLWCTNGTRAGVIVLMARTPPKIVDGKPKDQVTAFVVDMETPGITIAHRCHFMGLHALYNAVVGFKDVFIPRENILLAEGKGLRVALTTLNTGRLTLPAACIGLAKRCLEITRRWSNERVQWGSAIGHHAAIAEKIARMASDIFAMEAMTYLTSALVDRHDGTDVRLEAAACKMWCTEAAWRIVDDTLAIRGGRGYETAESLRARGEPGVPVERYMRDSRINLIFEGSSQIMRLFIAREALDTHLKVGGAVLNPKLPMGKRLGAAAKAAGFYAGWYPRRWLHLLHGPAGLDPALAEYAAFTEQISHKLARRMFHAMVKFGPKLEREQVLLGRFVDIGAELFGIAASVARAQHLLSAGAKHEEIAPLVEYFCRESHLRICHAFRGTRRNNDREGYQLARSILDGSHAWLGDGIVG